MPKCLVSTSRLTGIRLNESGGGSDFLYLREKIISMAYLEISGLKTIFHWNAHSVILSRSSESNWVEFGSMIR